MNRVFKFRAFDKSKLIMSKPFSFNQVLNFDDKQIRSLDYNNDIIMQFTGLKDKNGICIFEGDIVRWGLGFTGSYDKEHWHRYAVVEINPDIQFRIIYYETSVGLNKMPTDNYVFRYGNFAYKETDLYLEVIGNIHQNTELLNT